MSIGSRSRASAVGLSLLGAGIIHLAAVASHRESPAALASFVGLGLAQMLVGAGWLTAVPLRVLRMAAAAVTIPALVVWIASRTVGLPAWSGHHVGPEPAGLGDLVAVGLQLAALGLAFLPIRSRVARTSVVVHLALVVSVAALTVAGSFGVGATRHHLVPPSVAPAPPSVAPVAPAVTAVTPSVSPNPQHGHDATANPHGH